MPVVENDDLHTLRHSHALLSNFSPLAVNKLQVTLLKLSDHSALTLELQEFMQSNYDQRVDIGTFL